MPVLPGHPMNAPDGFPSGGHRGGHPAGRALRQVAVIGDGTGPGTPEPPEWPLETCLAGDADAIQGLARVPTVVAVATSSDTTAQFAARIQQLPAGIGAVFLTRTDPARARTVQHLVEQAGGRRLVVTEEDATAIALTAAAGVYLHRLGRDPHRCRILVAGTDEMPVLSPLLLASGFPDISLWNSSDGIWFPLRRAARDADVVIDLLRGDPPPAVTAPSEDPGPIELDLDRPEGSVITRRGLDARTLVAPGLLRALNEHPPEALPPGPYRGLGLYRVCVQALVRAAPPRRLLHDQPLDGALSAAIADAVAVSLHLAMIQTEDETTTSGPRSPIDGRTETG